jgi:hypothetical protein
MTANTDKTARTGTTEIDNSPLSADELLALVRRVFQPQAEDRHLALLVDLPDQAMPDHPAWLARRQLAIDWQRILSRRADELGLTCELFLYRNVGMNNADLPASAWRYEPGESPGMAEDLEPQSAIAMEEILMAQDLILAPTELSATAPLKLAAKKHGFRAATMPGFGAEMMAALRLDYGEIDRRVRFLKEVLDRATGAFFQFLVGDQEYKLFLDLRHRLAQASGGLVNQPGLAGNLPSGETYIVPYEGEREKDPSLSKGSLPVQIGEEVVLYEIVENRAIRILSSGPAAEAEAEHLRREPAYGNMAELGLGVLGDFGLAPIGRILLDEKLGLHIAFGRSDHFGGQVGAADFSRPEAVIHLDRVYLAQTQPKVRVVAVDLQFSPGRTPLMREGAYVLAGLYQDGKSSPQPPKEP